MYDIQVSYNWQKCHTYSHKVAVGTLKTSKCTNINIWQKYAKYPVQGKTHYKNTAKTKYTVCLLIRIYSI